MSLHTESRLGEFCGKRCLKSVIVSYSSTLTITSRLHVAKGTLTPTRRAGTTYAYFSKASLIKCAFSSDCVQLSCA